MKNRFFIILLCLACTASFAQTKKGKAGTKPKPKPRTVTKAPAPVDTLKKTLVVTDAPPAPTKPVTSAGPTKPFERPLDGYYKQNDVINAKVTPYAVLREADIVYKRRVWEEFDLREKNNRYLASPKQRLIDVLMDAIAAGELTAYDPTSTKDDIDGDGFSSPLTPEKAKARMSDSTTVDKFDAKGEKIKSTLVAGEFSPDSVVRFRIKKDVMFDKQRSVEETRIIGIAPLVKPKIAGVQANYQPAFWIYFPAARQILVTKQVMNKRNDAAGLSFDDIFLKRMFTSYVVKQSNDKDESIKDYANGLDRLYESTRIKKDLMDWELNLWQY